MHPRADEEMQLSLKRGVDHLAELSVSLRIGPKDAFVRDRRPLDFGPNLPKR